MGRIKNHPEQSQPWLSTSWTFTERAETFAAASGSRSRPTAAAPGPYFLHENQYFPVSSKWIHLTPKRDSLNPLHRVTLGTAKLVQTINTDVTFSVSQPGAKRNPRSTPLWKMTSWELSPSYNKGPTPTHAVLNLSLQMLHVQPVYSDSHETAQIFPHFYSREDYSWCGLIAEPLLLPWTGGILVSTRDLPILVPVAQVATAQIALWSPARAPEPQ